MMEMRLRAGFASDAFGQTITYKNADGTEPYSYLIGVNDPISTTCDFSDNGQDLYPEDIGKLYGMNEEGALRWSKGNQCATGDGEPWPVKWSDYRQILAHYYTGINLMGGSIGMPDNRWNLLNVEAPSPMNLGQSYTVKLTVQNTSTYDWVAGEVSLVWKFARPEHAQSADWTVVPLPALARASLLTLLRNLRHA